MEVDGKVKYRGLQIEKVTAIDYSGGDAQLTLAIDSDKPAHIPSNASVRIAATTVFGAKSVEFLAPDSPSADSLRSGAHARRRFRSMRIRYFRRSRMCCTRSIPST
jgi:phospholipid/cholesterol/gamma-HCH transport system substrate-binding protein